MSNFVRITDYRIFNNFDANCAISVRWNGGSETIPYPASVYGQFAAAIPMLLSGRAYYDADSRTIAVRKDANREITEEDEV